jgi:dienelactone hydrolase
MDAYGVYEELKDMARRLDTVGYHVLLPNLYYRAAAIRYMHQMKKRAVSSTSVCEASALR